MKLRVATCRTLPEVDVDAAPLAIAHAAHGFSAELVAWDDPTVDWDAPIPTILRSTWNYALDVVGFLSWIDRVSETSTLWNPPAVVHGNRDGCQTKTAGTAAPLSGAGRGCAR